MTTLTLTQADVLSLAAGGSIAIQGPAPVVVVPPPPPPPPSNALKVVIAQNGKTPLWTQNYSYSANDTDDLVDVGDGNPDCLKVVVTGQWGAVQPSNLNNVTTDFSTCTEVVVSLKPTVPNQKWSMFFLKIGDLPITGAGVQLPGAFGPVPVVGKYAQYVVPIALLTKGSDGVDHVSQIYKGDIQDQTGLAANTWYVDNWGGK